MLGDVGWTYFVTPNRVICLMIGVIMALALFGALIVRACRSDPEEWPDGDCSDYSPQLRYRDQNDSP